MVIKRKVEKVLQRFPRQLVIMLNNNGRMVKGV